MWMRNQAGGRRVDLVGDPGLDPILLVGMIVREYALNKSWNRLVLRAGEVNIAGSIE
jgi:hypothetical protein